MAESTGLTQIHPCICPLSGVIAAQERLANRTGDYYEMIENSI
jgi:hypothetical protein